MDGSSLLFGTGPIQWIQQFFGLGHPLPFRIFSLLGDTWGMILIIGVAFWLFGRERLHAAAAAVVAGAAAKVLLSSVFQQERPRGEGIVVYERLEVSSFPSGHVFEAVGPWGVLFALGCISFGLAALVVVLVGLGRLYLGAHFLGDVLGGIAFGVAFVWLFHRAWPGARRWLHARSARSYAITAAAASGACMAWMLLMGGGPRRWEVAGIVIGGALGLVLEHRYLKYSPGRDSRARQAGKVAIGLTVIAAMLLLDRSLAEHARLPGTLTAGFSTLWAVVGAPMVFARLGWGALDAHSRTADGSQATEIRVVRLRGSHGSRARTWGRRIVFGLLALLLGMLLWGLLIGPRWIDVEEHVAVIPALPPELEGERIAVIADLQVGMWWANTGTVRRVVEKIRDARPAAVLIAGDFVYHADGRVDRVADEAVELLRPLTAAGIPTYAVLGNHDYSIDQRHDTANPRLAGAVASALERAGIVVLRNQARPLAAATGRESLFIVGIDDEWAGLADPAAALAGVPAGAPRVVFMHNPHSFGRIPAGAAPLAVAGHTHGGQLALPFLPRWSWMTLVKKQEVYADGWIRGYGGAGNRLYVNVGIGFSDVPIRLNARPELTFFTLRRERAGAAAPTGLREEHGS